MEIIMWRTGISDKNSTICNHHIQTVQKRYSEKQKSCCDPYGKHLHLGKNVKL